MKQDIKLIKYIVIAVAVFSSFCSWFIVNLGKSFGGYEGPDTVFFLEPLGFLIIAIPTAIALVAAYFTIKSVNKTK